MSFFANFLFVFLFIYYIKLLGCSKRNCCYVCLFAILATWLAFFIDKKKKMIFSQTVTTDFYSQQLSRVDQTLCCQGMDTKTIKFLYYNAWSLKKLRNKKLSNLAENFCRIFYAAVQMFEYNLFCLMQHFGKKQI